MIAGELKPQHIGMLVYLPEDNESYPLFGRLDAVVIKPHSRVLHIGAMEIEIGDDVDIDLIQERNAP